MKPIRALWLWPLLLLVGCSRPDRSPTTLTMWAMGSEAEQVRPLLDEFERSRPGVKIVLQALPWSAAHEKLLISIAGQSAPDVAQLGNTWVSELAAMGALSPLETGDLATRGIDSTDYFPGIWATNRVDGQLYGVPWYVDTRVLFYRDDLLQRVGYDHPPRTWTELRDVSQKLKAVGGADHYALELPPVAWEQPMFFMLQNGATLLRDGNRFGNFATPQAVGGIREYLGYIRDGLAPRQPLPNLYASFADGQIAMFISGPWEVYQLNERYPDLSYRTAPLPVGPARAASSAGGSSLVVFKSSPRRTLALDLIGFLSRPDVQTRFYRRVRDLPARRSAWADSSLTAQPKVAAFFTQLESAVPAPAVPEYEQIGQQIRLRLEEGRFGDATPEAIAAHLQADADRILAKRRWLLDKRHDEAAR